MRLTVLNMRNCFWIILPRHANASKKKTREDHPSTPPTKTERPNGTRKERLQGNPIRLGITGQLSYVFGLYRLSTELNQEQVHLSSGNGVGFGTSAILEVRVHPEKNLFLQLEGGAVSRSYQYQLGHNFLNMGSNCIREFYETSGSIRFNDYRLTGRIKIPMGFQFGAYYTWLKSANRRGTLHYNEFCQSQLRTVEVRDNFKYDLNSAEQFPTDSQGHTPLNREFGMTVGWENPTHQDFLFGIGVDMSLNHVLNRNYRYDEIPTAIPVDHQTNRPLNFRLANAYIRFGYRI